MKEGVALEIINPQVEIRRNAEKARDWEFKDEAAYLYEKAVVFRDRFLDPIARIDRGRLPDPIIGFDNMRNYKVLAGYLVRRDAVGLDCRINFNSQHYIEEDDKVVWRFGRWAQMETLLHEYLHLWQQQIGFGKDPFKPGKSPHNKEFVEKALAWGLHVMPDVGCHLAVADEPFSLLMREWGIERPEDVPRDARNIDWFKVGRDIQGRSSLAKWTCPECGINVRVGMKGDPQIRHHPCEENTGKAVFFVTADGLAHTIYQVQKPPKVHARDTRLVIEAYQTLINLAGKDRGERDAQRLEGLEEKAQERLFRRLDGLTNPIYQSKNAREDQPTN